MLECVWSDYIHVKCKSGTINMPLEAGCLLSLAGAGGGIDQKGVQGGLLVADNIVS